MDLGADPDDPQRLRRARGRRDARHGHDPAARPGERTRLLAGLLDARPRRLADTGEIDILEDVNALSQHPATLHCGNLTDANPDGTLGPCHEFTGLSSGLRPCPGCQKGFHAYTAVVDRRHAGHEQIRWYLDGRRYFQVDQAQVGEPAWSAGVHHGYSIIFDLAIGGGYPDGVCGCTTPTDQTTSGATMTVRSVAVYTRRR